MHACSVLRSVRTCATVPRRSSAGLGGARSDDGSGGTARTTSLGTCQHSQRLRRRPRLPSPRLSFRAEHQAVAGFRRGHPRPPSTTVSSAASPSEQRGAPSRPSPTRAPTDRRSRARHHVCPLPSLTREQRQRCVPASVAETAEPLSQPPLARVSSYVGMYLLVHTRAVHTCKMLSFVFFCFFLFFLRLWCVAINGCTLTTYNRRTTRNYE